MVEYQTGIEINMFKLLKLSHMGDSENTEKSMVTIFVMEKGLIVLIHRKIHGVKKDDTEPKEIPCCGCGSWFLLDIQGEPIEGNEVKVLGLDDIFTFGKYKDKTIKEVIDTDWNYVKWAIIDSQRLIADIDAIVEYHKGKIKILQPDDVISFGKYKGKTLQSVFLADSQYLKWMESQNPDFKVDWDKLSDFSQE